MKKTTLFICLWFIISTTLGARSLQSFSADYRLLFNGEHVGDSRFTLKLTANNHYNFEAFTLPAGSMSTHNGRHEVLESSSGKLQGSLPVPDYYYTAVRGNEGTLMLEFFYDWQKMTLTRKDDKAQNNSPLKQQSQDRLSYLLCAMTLAVGHKNSITVPLLTSAGSKQLSIRKKNSRHLNTPIGRVLAQELELKYQNEAPNRSLWLLKDQGYVPVLLEQKTDKGIIRMELMNIL